MSKKYVLQSFIWGFASKLLDAGIKFISIPLLLSYFGENDFGLITLAISVNAYMQLLDMGVNTGAIKFFSEWISQKRFNLLDSTARTSISFYGIIGLINTVLLVLFAFFGMGVFAISPDQQEVLKSLFLILAVFATLNWSTGVFSQLLTANHNIQYVKRVELFKSLANLLVIVLTIKLEWNLQVYFILFCVANSFIVIPNYVKARKSNLISGFLPKTDWKNFRVIFKYSLAIIAMGVFQMSATKLRPVVLGIFAPDATSTLVEYRVMETITLFIISIAGMFVTIFLPMTTKLILAKDQKRINHFVYNSTLSTSIISAFLCFPFIVSGKEILEVYVGENYVSLYPWLCLWIVTILFYIHNSPVSSLVLSSGKTKMLVLSSAIACIISLIINALGAVLFGVGSAVIGYTVYIIIQMSFYYFYFNTKILKLNSWKVFKAFILPTCLAGASLGAVKLIDFDYGNIWINMMTKIFLWIGLFLILLFITNTLNITEIKRMIKFKDYK